jgi:predicted RNase H-like nuclease (RuvC/YqgF family)
MYPYGYYQMPPMQYDVNQYDPYNTHEPQDQFDPDRQPPQFQNLERRVNRLERENDRQQREINQLQRRVQRINQRLRQVERRFNFPYTPFD